MFFCLLYYYIIIIIIIIDVHKLQIKLNWNIYVQTKHPLLIYN